MKWDYFAHEGTYLLATPVLKGGYYNYRTRITIIENVENDPNMKCRNYDENLRYSQCLQKRYSQKVKKVLGCYPPWLVANKTLWCNNTFSGVEGTDIT